MAALAHIEISNINIIYIYFDAKTFAQGLLLLLLLLLIYLWNYLSNYLFIFVAVRVCVYFLQRKNCIKFRLQNESIIPRYVPNLCYDP